MCICFKVAQRRPRLEHLENHVRQRSRHARVTAYDVEVLVCRKIYLRIVTHHTTKSDQGNVGMPGLEHLHKDLLRGEHLGGIENLEHKWQGLAIGLIELHCILRVVI